VTNPEEISVADRRPASAEWSEATRPGGPRTAARAEADRLAGLLAQVFDGEPAVGGGVEAVFRRAEAIRRRRLRHVLLAGVAAVLAVATVGYVLTSAVLPTTPKRAPGGAAAPSPVRDPVREVLTAVTADQDLRVAPRTPARGEGWRQFTVLSRDSGRARGLVQISVYAAPAGLCFPVRGDPDGCARPDRSGNVEHVRYTDDSDADWQVTQAIARRVPDGRVVVVMATGERGTGDAEAGRPPLTGPEVTRVALNPRVMDAFQANESCNGSGPACPVLRVALPDLAGTSAARPTATKK
jgi:hypothetical protein